MLIHRWMSVLALVATLPAGAVVSRADAQGITTGAIGGLVTDTSGAPLAEVQIQVRNLATGYVVGSQSRDNGRYLVPGLEAGGPYTVTARRIGFAAQTRENVFVSLTQTTKTDFQMSVQATQLSGVAVVATTSDFSATRTGVSTTVGDSTIARIPTLNRDFTDLVKLSPHVSSPVSGQGPSAAGTYNRFNNYTIDGANQNDRFNLAASGGVPGGAVSGRLISIDAVKEFQVLLTPADVRYGNFAGMLVNAVTKSGTNTLTGGATYTYRNPKLAANEPFLRNSDFEVQQYGFFLGGPIIKNKLHFFIAPEWQARSQPATGPFEGGPTTEAGNINPDSLRRIANAINPLFPIGATGLVRTGNPLTNLSGRLDWQVTDRNRVVFRQLINTAKQDNFSRNNRTYNAAVGNQNSGFRLTSNMYTTQDDNVSSVLQLFSQMGRGASNEFLVGYNKIKDERLIPVQSPEISVQVTNLQGNTNSAVTFGTEEFSPGNLLKQDIIEASNNFNLPVGAHTLTFGGRYEHAHIFNNFAQRAYGVYAFSSIAALEAKTPANYSYGYSNGGPIAADFNTAQFSLYAQDQWTVSNKLSVTYGVRADVPQYLDTPVQNTRIAAAFTAAGLPAVNTSAKPKTQVLWSPRVGFNWDPTGDNKNQVRGAIGVFTGPTPAILVGNAYANTGLGLVTLNCTGAQTPAFTTDITALPRSCQGQAAPAPGQAGTAGINVTDPNFKNPQNFTTSLGFDRQLPMNFIFTFEGLYRKSINGILVRDLNLKGPKLVGGSPYRDRNGRILYADTISATGVVTNSGQRVITSIGTPAVNFTEGVIQVTNQSKDYSYSLSTQLRRRFGHALDLTAGYTYMRSFDLQSLTSDRAISNWRNGAQFAGLESDLQLAPSVFDRPHRVTASGTYSAPWKTAPTEVSFFYSGFKGIAMVYTANGDLNGDGFNGNDPIYVPRNATDPNEIRFVDQGAGATLITAATQAAAFEKFISDNECLDKQRGKIMERNSCYAPWLNRIDFSLRQSLPQVLGQRLTAQLDIFNFGNFVGRIVGKDEWGQQQSPVLSPTFPQQQALTVRGRTAGALNQSYTTYNFNANLISTGAFQRQQTLAGNFYQMQLTLKYTF
ncbi:MAG TPA: TonB-dependent receptor [Gemmatimonadaceae bacterium]|nr:TonB-dependent receptor [Gemmatimonadaceae bacterium]